MMVRSRLGFRFSVLPFLVFLLCICRSSSLAVADGDGDSFISDHFVQYNPRFFCGPVCLCSALHCVGIECDLMEVAQRAHLTYRGTSLYGLRKAAESYGATARIRSLKREIERQENLPFIAFNPLSRHFVLVLNRTDNQVMFHDPATSGIQEMARAEFVKQHDDAILAITSKTRSPFSSVWSVVVAAIAAIAAGGFAYFVGRRCISPSKA